MYPQEPFYFAHRGGNETAPENSLRSFLAAYDVGCRYLELDIRATRDGRLFVVHDKSFKRTTGDQREIEDLHSQDVLKIKYPNGDSVLEFERLIPSLPEDAKFNIDPKSDKAATLLVGYLERSPRIHERISIGSFSTRRITSIRSKFPHICTVGSRREVLEAFGSYLAGKTLNTPAKALQIPLIPYFRPHLRAEFAEYLHEQGLQVHVWTVNGIDDMDMLFGRGFDAVMTDKPTIAQSYFLTKRGK